ncbi:MAG: adenylate/guanylate cyclase domain-containing response regulator [Mesorhizobium sp.]|uniref:adenylate/guanylate cyclase domain-containing protein n=1 Tax=Mesorhizobium sp. TaxID=1871066 RepID=UPI000FE46D0A|nr:adenylate/guanylate cyclase domain-containing protein [Mesorhizobium sp.]RWD67050.1 MAG: adenylate/guanylate cyclase domain-containing response regulator [Mesorhizobium sp.]RWE06525.1 MAG: adenylate/guanylate cyclase domain-containing response regulator [Mesorhizobium sp.]RWE33558.1 MAG: adenylate/guanylate cyclase domain-containing response regulator [Mesorhizobium sp.]TIW00404.1 MAG: adenylate/guanylate cyclase domain-containing response regulator [Mesorhizobium sp.]TJW87123.1 MAG: adenyl
MSARILVVDDEPDLESLLLQKFRHQVRDGSVSFLFAHDGVDALELLERNGDVDMIVCDINMPRMDGLSLLQKLQEAERQLSTIIVSAYGDMANIRTAMNRGAFDFLMKPIDFADLEATIAKTLRHLETLREARRRQAAAERAHAALSRYFSPNLAARLASDGDAVGLAGQRREVAALFTDIAGFTTLVETMEPDTLGDLLNDYLAGMTDIVFRHEGTVAKVVGDALHVLFGAPSEQPDHAVRAVACALELDAFSEAFREQWRTKRIVLGPTRIGVNAGPAMVGNFGGVRFFDYTAYGDTINIAARLEAANKQLGTRICVSESVARAVPDFRGRPVGDLVLRGRTEPLRAYEPLPPDRAEDDSADGYGSAFARLEADDPGAIGAFAAEVGRRPGDQLASFHLKRLLNGAKGIRIQMD